MYLLYVTRDTQKCKSELSFKPRLLSSKVTLGETNVIAIFLESCYSQNTHVYKIFFFYFVADSRKYECIVKTDLVYYCNIFSILY